MNAIVAEAPSLRDQFAMHALQGLLAATYRSIETIAGVEAICEDAYDLADTMLEARKK